MSRPPTVSMVKQFLNPPNWFSAASLFCGLYAIVLSGQADGDSAKFYTAGVMIIFAGIFDMLDGRVARMTGTASSFGVQLDSLIDVVSFGIAPSIMLYFWALEPFGLTGVFVAFVFMICGAFRLARFNCLTEVKASKFSQGLTITMAGGTLAVVIMWSARAGYEGPNHLSGVILLAMVEAILMVSSVPYRGVKTLRLSSKVMAGITIFAASCVAIASIYDISAVFVLVGLLHVASGPVEALMTWPRRRRAKVRARREGLSNDERTNPDEPDDRHP